MQEQPAPGQTIEPGSPAPAPVLEPPAPAPEPAPPVAPPEAPEQTPQPLPEPPQPDTNWQFTPEAQDNNQANPAPQAPTQTIKWTASEFIAHHKSAGWYFMLMAAAILIMGGVYLLTQDVVSTVIIALVLIVLGVFASRKPRTLPYQVDENGLQIGARVFAYGDFKSFSVIDDGPIHSMTFMPLKRFMPPISMYYEAKDEPVIVNAVSAHLPFEEGSMDVVERIMRRIHF